MLRAVIDSKKIILVIGSNRKQEITQHLRFVMKNIVNVALLKEKQKNSQHISQ